MAIFNSYVSHYQRVDDYECSFRSRGKSSLTVGGFSSHQSGMIVTHDLRIRTVLDGPKSAIGAIDDLLVIQHSDGKRPIYRSFT